MQRMIKMAALAAVTIAAGTVAASADEFGPSYGGQFGGSYAYNDSYAMAPGPVEQGYVAVAPGGMYRPAPGWGAGYNGTNHPTPSSSQGDVGPQGNNNGTLTGVYRQW